MDRRNFVVGSAAAAATLAAGPSFAQEAYPSRPVTFINPFPPGGAVDVVARPLAAVLEPLLKQPVVIETKAGAAGQVGAQFAATAKPDGYTILMHIVSISGFAEVDKLFGRPAKFTNADFIPIARFVADPMVLVVNDQQPYKTLKELVEDAKKRPNALIFSSSGFTARCICRLPLFMKAAGIQMKHLPTAGGGPALTAILGNNSQVLVSSIAAANAQMKAGKLRPLACFGANARAGAAERADHEGARLRRRVPSVGRHVRAQGHAGADRHERCATPPRRPPPITKFRQAMKNLGQDVAYLDQAEFKTFWDADAKRVEDAVRPIGKIEA